MFKKISVALLVVALLIAAAVPMTVGAATLIEKDVDVVANIKVKSSGSSDYVDAPAGKPLKASTGATFDYMATLDMSSVRGAYTSYLAKALIEVQKIDPAATESDFTVSEMKIRLTAIVDDGLSVNSNFQGASDMAGFSAWDEKGNPASDISIYTESDARTKDGKEVSITVGLANVMTADQLAGKLGDLKFEFKEIKATKSGLLKVKGILTGYTDIAYKGTPFAKINYTGVQDSTTGDDDLTATVLINSQSSSSGSGRGGRTGGGNAGTTVTAPQIITNVNGRPINAGYAESVDGQYVVDVDELPEPDDVPGYASSNKWYRDPGCTIPAEGRIPVDGETTLYTRYVNITAPSKLISDKHLAYIIGYPDGYIQPEKNISREEVAVILYRLLNKDVKASIYAETNNFSDVEDTRWSNTAISTMSNGAFIQGYPNGTYQPQKFITRAEFATLLVRFLDEGQIAAGDFGFVDISGHWAEADIKKAADYMWILGYTDGTFKPDQNITRAEAITIFNRVLVRYADAEGVLSSAKQWADVTSDKWYYYQIIEATNSHDFTRRADRYNETWTGLLEENLIY